MNDRYLRGIVLSFLIACKDTKGNTLTWFFYMFCKNPVVQDKVAFFWAGEDKVAVEIIESIE
uniref:Uncharacterized protein n=1 Tax=Triticum urartu TaxID=4572 RepID=A0A8R7QUK9_TRIUA